MTTVSFLFALCVSAAPASAQQNCDTDPAACVPAANVSESENATEADTNVQMAPESGVEQTAVDGGGSTQSQRDGPVSALPTANVATYDQVQSNDATQAGSNTANSTNDVDSGSTIAIGLIVLGLIGLSAYLAPTTIALLRRHEYWGVILALNVLGGWTILGWFAALAWAVWPKEKSLIDPVMGNVTGKGQRNSGDTMGSVNFGRQRGFQLEAAASRARQGTCFRNANLNDLEKLASLRSNGILSEDEFEAAKAEVLGVRA